MHFTQVTHPNGQWHYFLARYAADWKLSLCFSENHLGISNTDFSNVIAYLLTFNKG